jgi:hypothetical protein
MPVPPVALSLRPVVSAAQMDSLAGSPFRSGRSSWAMPAALTVLLIGIGFLAGRMTAPAAASPSSAAAQAAAADIATVATQAATALPAASVVVAPPTAAPDPEPTDKPLAATPSATAQPPSTQSVPPTQPTATPQAAAPVVTAARSQPVDPLVQAVQQDIQQELDSRKKH